MLYVFFPLNINWMIYEGSPYNHESCSEISGTIRRGGGRRGREEGALEKGRILTRNMSLWIFDGKNTSFFVK